MRTILRFCGEICLTAGAVGLLFVAYLMWGTGMAQHHLAAELNNQWSQAGPSSCAVSGAGSRSSGPEPQLVASKPFAFIRIPAFGPDWRFTVIQGTSLAQLNLSPGHVPGTQLPGQLGNFAVAGHRVTAGNPFWSLPSLRAGDLVCIDTEYETYTYRVLGSPRLVSPYDMAVLDPVPGEPGVTPTRRLITLITCDPAWTGTHRVIVTGQLVEVKNR
jgi:sortase A